MALVRRAETRFELVVVALCVMSSHYHLIVRGSQAELSRAMQWINGTYARDFNKRNGKFGAVWAERFSCRAVEEETLATVYAYVMNNPVRAGLCATPEDWPWTYGRHGLGGSV